MKHAIKGKSYLRSLDSLTFTITTDDNIEFYCDTYCLDLYQSDSYKLEIFDSENNLLYDVVFDSDIGIFRGNERYFNDSEIQPIIDEAFKIIANYMEYNRRYE